VDLCSLEYWPAWAIDIYLLPYHSVFLSSPDLCDLLLRSFLLFHNACGQFLSISKLSYHDDFLSSKNGSKHLKRTWISSSHLLMASTSTNATCNYSQTDIPISD